MKDIILWLWLCGEQKVSQNNIIRLHNEYGLKTLYFMDEEKIARISFLRDKEKNFIIKKDLSYGKILYEYCLENNINVISYDDINYPNSLKILKNPPPVLFYRGNISIFNKMIGITFVGSRNASSYGINIAREFSFMLSSYDLLIVSGAAVGIDTAAHKGALMAQGVTAAVLGCGIDVPYPKENQDLLLEIAKQGAVISEFLPGTLPHGRNFPHRNRILAALSYIIAVIEAGYKSGALTTVHHGLAYGKEIFALPGDINKSRSAGANLLIRDGARILLSANDILEDCIDKFPHYFIKKEEKEELDIIKTNSFNNNICNNNLNNNILDDKINDDNNSKREITSNKNEPLIAAERTFFSSNEEKVLSYITKEPTTIDEICKKTDLDAGVVNGILTLMELKGIVIELPGKKYVLK